MRKIIAEIAVSVDGFIEGKNGQLDWLVFDEEKSFVHHFLSRFDIIFYGRLAYERFGVLPGESEVPEFTIGPYTHIRKYVFTRSQKHVDGKGMVISNRLRENVMKIKAEEGKDIWLCGGANIIKKFASLGLIDQYILAIQPVVLGSGKPLFKHLPHRLQLQLLNAEVLSSGVVILNYRPLVINNSTS
jgi:dihydrofolate reductase